MSEWHQWNFAVCIQSVSNWCNTLFETLFLSNEVRQNYNFLLWMISKALEEHSNTFFVFHVFKQIWRLNYHLMNFKWLLRCYWKVKNVVQRRWRVEFGTPLPTRVTITRIRDKFEVDGTVQDVLKGRCRRKRSSTDNESADAVMQGFARYWCK